MLEHNPKSTAKIGDHPIHPMLVGFPIALFVSAFVCDVVFWQTMNPDWFRATVWLLGGGLIMAALAAVMGLIDFLDERRIRDLNDAWWHMGGNVLAVLIEAFNLYERVQTNETFVVPTGLVLSAIVVAILMFTGWKGWNLVYRHHVAVSDEAPEHGRHA
jgi:uncharacterized membrane protein